MKRFVSALTALVVAAGIAGSVYAANPDRANGFKPFDQNKCTLVQLSCAAAATFVKGDVVKYSSGVTIATGGTDIEVLGVAAEGCTSGTPTGPAGDYVDVWLANGCQFVAQTSGTGVAATHTFALIDYEGTTGIMELDENGSNDAFFVFGKVGKRAGRNDWGANVELYGMFVRPQVGWADMTWSDVVATGFVRANYGLTHSQSTGLEVAFDGTHLAINGSNKLDIKGRYLTGIGQAGGANTFTLQMPPCPVSGTITAVTITSDTATSGSDGSNKWAIDLSDGADNDLSATDYNTNDDAEMAADTAFTITSKLDQNLTCTAGEQLKLVFTETGTATDLSGAFISAVIAFDDF